VICGIARLQPPVGPAEHECLSPRLFARSNFAPVRVPQLTNSSLHCARQVIIAEDPENPAKVAERQLVSFKKCLLCGVRVGPVKRPAAGHRTHLEDLQLGAFTVKIGVCLVPIHLRFHAPVVALRNKNLVSAQPLQPLLAVNVAAHRALTSREAG
jgi:hypothetical protein